MVFMLLYLLPIPGHLTPLPFNYNGRGKHRFILTTVPRRVMWAEHEARVRRQMRVRPKRDRALEALLHGWDSDIKWILKEEVVNVCNWIAMAEI